jgi:hypothetical protein
MLIQQLLSARCQAHCGRSPVTDGRTTESD